MQTMQSNGLSVKPKVLLTNDDGIDAPGLRALFDEIVLIADVTIVAPKKQCSAIGHAVSINNDMILERVEKEGVFWGYSLDGTPADCVKLALTKVLRDSPPELVISGINAGMNVGNSVLYSGTVAAAIEAAMYGVAGIAVSLGFVDRREEKVNYRLPAVFIGKLLPILLKNRLPAGVILNINVPNIPDAELKGVVIARQGKSMFVDVFEKQNEFGEIIAYKNVGDEFIMSEHDGKSDFDDYVLHQNKIAITPLHYDLTHHHFMEELKRWIEDEEIPDISRELKKLSKNLDAQLE